MRSRTSWWNRRPVAFAGWAGALCLGAAARAGVLPPTENLAPSGTAFQSTTDFGGDASRGIDGISDGNYGNASVTHTDVPSSDNFWQVDLDGEYYLYDVNLYNRSDFDDGRLSNFRLSILRDGEEVYGANYFEGSGGVPRGGVLNVPLPAVFGDAVKVQILGLNNVGNGILSLGEVQAFGSETPVPEPGRLAPIGLAITALAIRRKNRP